MVKIITFIPTSSFDLDFHYSPYHLITHHLSLYRYIAPKLHAINLKSGGITLPVHRYLYISVYLNPEYQQIRAQLSSAQTN